MTGTTMGTALTALVIAVALVMAERDENTGCSVLWRSSFSQFCGFARFDYSFLNKLDFKYVRQI